MVSKYVHNSEMKFIDILGKTPFIFLSCPFICALNSSYTEFGFYISYTCISSSNSRHHSCKLAVGTDGKGEKASGAGWRVRYL